MTFLQNNIKNTFLRFKDHKRVTFIGRVVNTHKVPGEVKIDKEEGY